MCVCVLASFADFAEPASVPRKPINEQQEIAEHISKINTKIGLSIDLISTKINLLIEYRKALISAAVTGKIDVRESV